MTHLIQFSVDIDEDRIRKQIEMNTATMVEKAMFDGGRYAENNFYGVQMSSTMQAIVNSKVDAFLNERSAEIVDCAAKYLAEKLSRRKVSKEMAKRVGE